MTDVHQWPPMQGGEAARATTRALVRYVRQHWRWLGRLDPREDNYLAIHQVNAAKCTLAKRVGWQVVRRLAR